LTERADALATLAGALEKWRNGPENTYAATHFARDWRSALVTGGFSARAQEVSEGLLVRIESAQSFGGESCSFSLSEMQGAFEALLEKLKTAK
jgi:hypothetical protein